MLMRWTASAVLLGALVGGCGGTPGLPDQGECPPIEGFQSTVLQDRAYRITVARELEAIAELDDEFRTAWDERRIRELPEFRVDFARYAHLTRCHAAFILALPVPTGTSADFERQIQDYATRLLASLERGEDAVATRNASEYRSWVREIDGLDGETTALLDGALQ